jgi:FkbM family methyltransferase
MPLTRSIKDSVKSIPILGPIAFRLYASYNQRNFEPTHLIQRKLRGEKAVQVVQIGSNDGEANDPIHRLLDRNPSWNALFVEPVPYVFARLKKNYGDNPRFRFENVAITESSGLMNFYHVSEQAKESIPLLPAWYDQVGSFSREHVRKVFGQIDINPHIVSAEVRCLTLQEMLDRNGIRSIDVLHIDTEGHDWLILQQLDLSRYRPAVILFESVHLTPEQKSAARFFLERFYDIKELPPDWYCQRRDA